MPVRFHPNPCALASCAASSGPAFMPCGGSAVAQSQLLPLSAAPGIFTRRSAEAARGHPRATCSLNAVLLMPTSSRPQLVFEAATSDPDLGIRKGDHVAVDPVTLKARVIREVHVQPGRLLGALEDGKIIPLTHQHDDAVALIQEALGVRGLPRRRRSSGVLQFPPLREQPGSGPAARAAQE